MPRGRPRRFDTEQAVQRLTHAFWTHGYQGTSIDDLERSTGLARTSLYAAFGDKQAMFVRALGCYWQARMARTRAVLSEGVTARDGIAALLGKVVANLSDPAQPPGCLRVNSALEAGCLDPGALTTLRGMQAELEDAIADRVRDTQANARAVAGFLVVAINGLAVSARMGATGSELESAAALALAALPCQIR